MLEKLPVDHFRETQSPLKSTLILILSILIAEISRQYFYTHAAIFSRWDILMGDAVVLVVILLPILYFFVYKPIFTQCEKLKKLEIIQRELSLLDPLTGLYNRRGFMLHANHLLKLAVRTKKELLLIYADVDNLKSINDHLGHSGGDRAIACAAKVLTATFRGSDVIGRIGGDEFAILAFETKEGNMRILRNRLDQRLKEMGSKFHPISALTLSLGMIVYDPSQPKSIDDLLKQADALMYDAKRARHKAAVVV